MVNTTHFSQRLQQIMTHFGLSASALADQIGVQRSSISHVLSGRNKPSLDFIMKLVRSYPEIDLYWLLNGTGQFPVKPSDTIQDKNLKAPISLSKADESKEIARIVIFFEDGTFNSYSN